VNLAPVLLSSIFDFANDELWAVRRNELALNLFSLPVRHPEKAKCAERENSRKNGQPARVPCNSIVGDRSWLNRGFGGSGLAGRLVVESPGGSGGWSDGGMAESKVQKALRHKTASMTRRYTKTKEKGEVAQAVGEILLKAQTAHQAAQIPAQGGANG